MELQFNCPYCVEYDHGYHLYYNTDKNVYFCFRCHKTGKGRPKGESVRSGNYPNKSRWGLRRNHALLYELLGANHVGSIIVNAARKYLKSHHVDSVETAYRYRLMLEDEWFIFPVYERTELVYLQKRHLFSKRFMNPPLETKPLFWTEEVQSEKILLVESWMNAVRMAPFIDCVCILGKHLSEDQARRIVDKHRTIIVGLDHGELEAGIKILRTLSRVLEFKGQLLRLPRGDWCDLSNKAVRRILKCQ